MQKGANISPTCSEGMLTIFYCQTCRKNGRIKFKLTQCVDIFCTVLGMGLSGD
jgi:hypothetical protein